MLQIMTRPLDYTYQLPGQNDGQCGSRHIFITRALQGIDGQSTARFVVIWFRNATADDFSLPIRGIMPSALAPLLRFTGAKFA